MSRPSPLHQDALHESGYLHASGAARYVDDLPAPAGMLVAGQVTSPVAHGRILSRDASAALQLPGVVDVLFHDDVPGDNLIGAIVHDEPLFAQESVNFVGQVVALVLGESYEAVRAGVEAVEVEYEELPPVLTMEEAIAREQFHTAPHVIRRGDAASALEAATLVMTGRISNGAQDHFYLETHATLAVPLEDGNVHLYSSTQHPSEVQKLVSSVLDIGIHKVVCEVPRMGGAFGGKESQASNYACMAALGTYTTGRPVKVWLNRDEDMIQTGKRHPFLSHYEAGFDSRGVLTTLRVKIYGDAGWSQDLSQPIVDRALFHIDNAYFLENVDFEGRICRTNLPSNTAFRGFGGPQGMLVVEDALSRYAERTGRDPAEVRQLNYYGPEPRDRAPYGQEVTDCRLEIIHSQLMESSDYVARRAQIEAHNATRRFTKRGLAFQPVKFGISFTKSILNQAGAFVLVYTDGTVQLNHGGTEMGQGLHTKMIAICAHELGVIPEAIRVMHTATDKVPNTSATAASSGSDLNGQAVAAACRELRARMVPVAAEILGVQDEALEFCGGEIRAPGTESLSFGQLATECWVRQISLSATWFYSTPGIEYDAAVGQGRPFYYFAYGAAVVEVELSRITGEHRVIRADILHDAGTSLVPSIDIGQVEGAFAQGLGWLTMEEVLFSDTGEPLTTGPSTYKIPAVGDMPLDLRVSLLERSPQPGVIHGSKAVGEPPFMLAIAVLSALRHAISSFVDGTHEVKLDPPCTPEALLRSIEELRSRATQAEGPVGDSVAIHP
jgi:xanthine dehydrogenase large subunit